MTRIKFGSPRYARDLVEFAAWCELAERVGLDVLGSGDSSTLWIDPFVALTVAARHTKTARLVTTVTNPATRHPAVMASGFAGLQAASNGRAVMGIGGGDSAIYNLGLRPGTLATLEAYVQAVRGLTEGREVEWQGKNLKLQLGYSHDVDFAIPEGITIATPDQTTVHISGIDKQQVGQVAAEIRRWRKPEPYKGKGIKYAGEYIFRKEGKKK